MLMKFYSRRRFHLVAAGLAFSFFSCQSLAQNAVQTMTSREGTQASGQTGEWVNKATREPPQTSWPKPNNGQGWGVLNNTVATNNSMFSNRYEASGLTNAPQPGPVYRFDLYGNETYTNPATGVSQTFGTTTARIRTR